MVNNNAEITIISNGNPYETKILDSEGNPITCISGIHWDITLEETKLQLQFTRFAKVEIKMVCCIKMRKWFKTIYVCPSFVGHFMSKGYKVVKCHSWKI